MVRIIPSNYQLIDNYNSLLFVIVLCSFLQISLLASPPPAILCRSEEKTALLQFRSRLSCNESLDDCSRSFALSWKEKYEDCCSWNGVHCDNDTGYVVKLLLKSDHLYGNIPPNSSLFNLIHLERLDLSGNNFENSQISPLFGNFGKLTTLSLEDSGFSGVVPNEIFQLSNLQKLDLSGNRRLTGKLPDSVGELSSLQILSLGWCYFSGSIPTSIGNLSQLDTFNITNNNFTGQVPVSLAYLVSLTKLDLSHNNLEGPIIHSILNLTECSHLDLSSNQFTDAIDLDQLTKLNRLEYLHLSNSGLSLTTSNPNFLSAFPSINSLGLSSCDLGDNILTNLSIKSELLYIDLSNNKLGEGLDASICNLNSLYYLDLSHNQLNGLIPACLGNSIESLSMLNFQSNKFHGMIPRSFGYAKNIQLLDLSNNMLQGNLPKSLVNCTRLEVLNLGGNMLIDGFPFWLGNLSSLKVLILRENKINGTMSKISRKRQGQFENLRIIDMSHNDLTGTFPSSFSDSWNAMTIVDKEDASTYAYIQTKNQVPKSYSSTVYTRSCSAITRCRAGDPPAYYPPAYYYYYSLDIMNKGFLLPYKRVLAAMKVVDFSNNKIHGIIPPSVGRLKGIQVLNLSGNALTGPVPRFLGNLSKLESLDLSDNMLSGRIPQDLTNLSFLGVLDLSQNNLTGLVPGYLSKFPNTSYQGNEGLCGLPLSRLCRDPDKPNSPRHNLPSQKNHHSQFEFDLDGFGWEKVVGYGCGFVFGVVIGSCILVDEYESGIESRLCETRVLKDYPPANRSST